MNNLMAQASQAIVQSLFNPTEMAARVVAMSFQRNVLWMGLALVTVLNVLFLALLQLASPAPIAMGEQVISLSPFGYVSIIGIFLVLLSLMIYQTGRFFGGTATLDQTLAIIVWFQVVSLALELVQAVLVLIVPAIGALFGVFSLGVLLWVFLNFMNVLHGFESIAKALIVSLLAMLATGFVAGILMAVLGVGA